jgi:hypothetical protein
MGAFQAYRATGYACQHQDIGNSVPKALGRDALVVIDFLGSSR